MPIEHFEVKLALTAIKILCRGYNQMMVIQNKTTLSLLMILLTLVLVMQACTPAESSATPGSGSQVSPSVELPTDTALPPSPTPVPLAATVNGDSILLEDYEDELLRLQAALETTGRSMTPEEQHEIIMNNLVDQMLLAQAVDFYVDDETLQSRFDAAVSGAGGPEQFNAWLAENHYTEESFKRALSTSIAAAWQRDQIINSVSEAAEQVHVQQILLLDEVTAANVHQQLVGGANFNTLALQYDPVTGGALGWFPRSYITQIAIEEAAFSLEPGQFSDVITTDFGYHIIQVLEKDNDHPLSPDAYRNLQHQTLAGWLDQRKSESDIIILVP